MADAPLPAEADALYGLPPGEFVAARDALARQLREGARREEAAAVKALRRPSAAAAAVNRAARAHPEAVEELLSAGTGLRRAQERLIAGTGDRAVLREAAEHQRAAVTAVARLAAAEAEAAGTPLSAAVLDRVRETLQATATDERIREAVAAGRLEREAGPGGILLGPPVAVAPPSPEPRRPRAAAAGAARAARRAAEAERRASRQAAEARLRAAAEAVREAQADLEGACRAVEDAEAAVEGLRDRLATAEAEAQEARAAADAVRARVRRAKAEEAAAHAERESATRSP